MLNNVKLVKILIGSAWLDGKIQPEERTYLNRIAQEKGVAQDPEIYPLLQDLRQVETAECYQWVQEYLGNSPSTADYRNLLEAISGLIYSDSDVDTEEAKLLTQLQLLNPVTHEPQPAYNAVMKEIQKLYRRWVEGQK
ncbi:tellurite resistance TerB family protein [Chlorogloea sp. CCALA 695]|uniref:tellurite resistance TerB family protein n=1 Tax=Chlorogloea sp. CCALA 695 TaxID=2107693 RepID=UPI000D0751A4|nr:TerB family tellurite resistance protein [Chlorogloea sp. CCALA 695]PSB33343.1 Tellurite resistance protein TerB [Chlorogloea sp. CCALA 695]